MYRSTNSLNDAHGFCYGALSLHWAWKSIAAVLIRFLHYSRFSLTIEQAKKSEGTVVSIFEFSFPKHGITTEEAGHGEEKRF
jgi:hypothetical protein